jgi:phosphoribosyl-AMP cyclohydrolase
MTQPGAGTGRSERDEGPIVFDPSGLVPVVAQDETTGDVLLLAYMNVEALRRTLAEGVLVLWSRSRGRLWRKGERSGHVLRVRDLRVNCEGNSLLARVQLEGPGACHEGYRTCYFRRVAIDASGTVDAQVMEEQAFDPAGVYGSPGLEPSERSLSIRARQDKARSTINGGRLDNQVDAVEVFEQEVRALYAAYERLRDEDHTSTSATSRLLHQADCEAAARHALRHGIDELAELQGVLAGTHRHHGGEADVLLEAGQVQYWAVVAAVALGCPYEAWRPHALWLDAWSESHTALLPDGLLMDCAGLILGAGDQCRMAGVHPARVVAADLAAIRTKHPDSNSSGGYELPDEVHR